MSPPSPLLALLTQQCTNHFPKCTPAVVEGAARNVVAQPLSWVVHLGLTPVLEHAVALDLRQGRTDEEKCEERDEV